MGRWRDGGVRGVCKAPPRGAPLTSASTGSGRLCASWEPRAGPSTPSPVAAQFTSEGATLSGVDLELVGSGYRMSLVKRRFATGRHPL